MLYLNFTACVLFVNKLSGSLAARMHLRSSFFDAFTDIGSSHAKSFLLAKLARASAEPVAAQLRAEVDGPSAVAASSDVALRTWLESRLNSLEKKVENITVSSAASAHGILEITRSNHSEAERHLLSIGTKVTDGHLRLIAIEGGPLHLSVFLSERGVQADIIRRLTPTFSAEVKRRKLDRYAGEGPFWIAVSQGSWRPFYTEADRDLINEVFEDPLTKQNIEALRASSQPPRTLPPANNGRLRRRAGPYSRALRCTSSGAVTRLDTFFTRRVGDS